LILRLVVAPQASSVVVQPAFEQPEQRHPDLMALRLSMSPGAHSIV
jgi:hypothetical protein